MTTIREVIASLPDTIVPNVTPGHGGHSEKYREVFESVVVTVPPPTGTALIDLAAIQEATDEAIAAGGGVVRLQAGAYELGTGTITGGVGITYEGEGPDVTVINQSAASAFAFSYQSPLGVVEIKAGPSFKRMTINAKNAIDLNQSGDFATVFETQDFLMTCRFEHLTLWGAYGDADDPNVGTDVVPTQGELEDYGVGIRASKCFEMQVDKSCKIENYGCGVQLDGCDISTISGRFGGNARNIYAAGHDFYGGGLKVYDAELLVNHRAGGITLVGTIAARIRDNYFEAYSDAGLYLLTLGDINTHITGNRFADPGAVSTDAVLMMYFQPTSGLRVTDNDYETSIVGGYGTVAVNSGNWSTVAPICDAWRDNGTLPNANPGGMLLGVNSATTMNLPYGAPVVPVHGTATIRDITGGYTGQEVTLIFVAGLTVESTGGGTGNIRLAGDDNFTFGAYNVLTLIYTGPSYEDVWIEKSRMILQ